MIIKTLYLIITGSLFSISQLLETIQDLEKAFKYQCITTSWCFGVFGVAIMFEQGANIPPDILFYIAIAPTLAYIVWLLRKMKIDNKKKKV